MSNETIFTFYAPIDGAMEQTYITRDPEQVYRRLASEMRAHYISKAPYIKRIVDRNNYNGTRTITVYYDNARRGVYIIAA